MTPINDIELGQRLRALRVDPPDAGFEARLVGRLANLPNEAPAPAPAASGKLLNGPWRRRPARLLIAAAALSLAGAAAALEGGVVDWLRARVGASQRAAEDTAPRPEPARAPRLVPGPAPENAAPESRAPDVLREPTSTELEPPRPEPPERAPAQPAVPVGPSGVLQAPLQQAPRDVPRLGLDRSQRSSASPAAALPHTSTPIVPRVELAPRAGGRLDAEGRGGRVTPGGNGVVTRERGRELERIRDLARARRERAGTSERPRVLERLRDRREKGVGERRELSNERMRRERSGR